jgi:hypothetical protein
MAAMRFRFRSPSNATAFFNPVKLAESAISERAAEYFRQHAVVCILDPDSNQICYLNAEGVMLFDIRPIRHAQSHQS